MPNSILREGLSGAKSLEEVERILKDRPETDAKRAYGRKISIGTVPHGGPNLSFKLALKHHFWQFNASLTWNHSHEKVLKGHNRWVIACIGALPQSESGHQNRKYARFSA